jgi:hypothetical protein
MHNGLPVSSKPVTDRDRMGILYIFASGLLSPVFDKSSTGDAFSEFQSRRVLSNLLCSGVIIICVEGLPKDCSIRRWFHSANLV